MTIRTVRKTVTFVQPFRLTGIEGLLPPGAYPVDVDEELIESLTFLAHRHVATFIHVKRDGATQVHDIDPADLSASLLRDAGLTVRPGGEPDHLKI